MSEAGVALKGDAMLRRKRRKGDLRPRADMLDDFGGGQRAEAPADIIIGAARHARQKA